MIEFDRNILQVPLTVDDRDELYRILLNKSNLETELTKYYDKLSDYVKKAIITVYPDQDKLNLSLKCSRIIKKGIRIYIEAKRVGNLDKDGTHRYPTEYWNMENNNRNNNIKISSTVNFRFPYLKDEFFDDCNNCYDWINNLKDKKLKEAIISTYKYYISLLYNKTNFLIDYKDNNSYCNRYFSNISTWGNLFKDHKDWFELLYIERKERLIVEDKIKENPKSNESLLKDLRGILRI